LNKKVAEREINLGVSSCKDNSYPLGRKYVAEIVGYLLKENSISAIEKAIVILTTFLSIGRAGECGYVTYAQQKWNPILNIIDGKWNEKKTRKQNLMCYFHDYSDYRLDWYFLMFCYTMSGSGSHHTTSPDFRQFCAKRKISVEKQSLIFPYLINNGATKVSDYIKSLIGKVKYLDEGLQISARSLFLLVFVTGLRPVFF
jgi:hypothetical protein